MIENYFPNSADFDEMNIQFEKIALAIGKRIDVSTWAKVRNAVKSGIAPIVFPVGTELSVNHSVYGKKTYLVVAHNYFKSSKNNNDHTMTIMSDEAFAPAQYDESEAFYYAESRLAAGTYNFTLATAFSSWAAGTYQFTLTNALPSGGQLCISGSPSAVMTSAKVKAYSSRLATDASETVAISVGSGGVNLGTFGVELNHISRVAYGSNNYKESAIRQFLNSSADAGSVWSPQTKFDRPPSWQTTLAGFAGGLDTDFLSIVGEVLVPCATNNIYESTDSTTPKGKKYTVSDKFYLASQKEIFGDVTNVLDDSSILFPYYDGATNADRVKSATSWWTRSALATSSCDGIVVNNEGILTTTTANTTQSCAVVCTII